MAFSNCASSAFTRARTLMSANLGIRCTIIPANNAMMAMTTSISMRVKAATFWRRIEVILGSVQLPQFLLHALTEPLFDHALVIEVSRPGQPLNPRQHPRIDSQGNRDRLGNL